ncbi:PREDICTED: NAC domain-containing protein 82-like [Camelina sativa]|uniref:NAC domain-containing protein 82-like n=1 Tax=Camelina sativa TaxID=90675 RepID=A0ABM0UTT8_CAMSA|nr:PREDICTED: NAC domain-containing protein 82-like [Camelina sativa]
MFSSSVDISDSYVLCVLFKKNGLGPRHGSQYGAPYKDEDWSGDEEEDTQHLVAIPSAVNAGPGPGPSKETSLVATTSQSHAVKDCLTAGVISESCVSDVPPLTATVLPPLTSDVVGYAPMSSSPLLEVPHVPHDDDDELNSMLDLFSVVNDECLPFDDFDYPNGVRDEPDVYVNEEEAPVVLGDGNFSGMFDLSDEQVMEMEDLIQPPTPPSPDAQASNPDESRS